MSQRNPLPHASTRASSSAWLILSTALLGSLLLHGLGVGLLATQEPQIRKKPIAVAVKIKTKVVEKPKPQDKPKEEKKPEAEKPKPKVEKPKPKPKPKPKKSKVKKKPEKKPKKQTLKGSKTPQKATRVVQGLNPASLTNTPGKNAIAVPVGNTMLKEDEGIRLKPEEVEALSEDLSEDAAITCKKTPPYTEEAEDEGLEGQYKVDVYVTAKGRATEAEPQKKIGFGMDKVVSAMLLNGCTYTPKRNAKGHAIASWATFTIRLTLD